MARFIAFCVLLAGGGYAGYRYFHPPQSEAYQAYRQFAKALLDNDHAQAYALTDGDVARLQVKKAESLYHFMQANGMLGVTHGATYDIESETKAEGEGPGVTLVVTQVVRRDPPGTHSGFGAVAVRHKHTVRMTRTEEGWKVASFEDEIEGQGGEPRRSAGQDPHARDLPPSAAAAARRAEEKGAAARRVSAQSKALTRSGR